MAYHPDDTICAIGTACGGGARGMVRISGPDAVAIAARLFTSDDCRPLDGFRRPTAIGGGLQIVLDCNRPLSNPPLTSPYEGGKRGMPCDLFLWPANQSYTREPVAELHTLGSRPILQAVLTAACRAGARLAEPGEFTLRAFLAGRIDLTQAEAVLGVIDAAGDDELAAALAQLAGGLARPLQQLRDDLIQLLAELEAGLDFVDDDIRFISQSEILERLEAANTLLENISRQMKSRHAAVELNQVALIGPTNVGKSSLFNAIVQRRGVENGTGLNASAPALVSSQRGTTRDYLAATISVNGIQCELVDTAGVDANNANNLTPIDATARAFAMRHRERADLRACCVEASAWKEDLAFVRRFYDDCDCDLIVLTKADLAKSRFANRAREETFHDEAADGLHSLPTIVTSSHTGQGLDAFCNAVRTLLTRDASQRCGPALAATAERCHESVRLAANAIRTAADIAQQNAGDELLAAELRLALAELGKVVGAVYTDDLLDRIFKTFCIGK